ncbi:hypothetical protein KUL156_54650 [Alteromonas sp. KUL156]|nr:hypothetical protein KUL154_30000 [Alteromonas sp. KUL154]GFE02873.1 hypothetical protein KUL156_54650 [Alteromonas sp. KUL156]
MKKTITFAVMHFGVAFTIAYLLTGSVVVGGAVALVEPAINTVAFYFHEMIWKKFEAQKERASPEMGAESTPSSSARQDMSFAS